MFLQSTAWRASVGLLLGVLCTAPVSLLAQPQVLRGGQSPGPRFIVPTFRNGGGNLGFRVAEAVRDRLASDFTIGTLWVVPEATITAFLLQSGFQPTEALGPNDLRQLATHFRAEEYFQGRVQRTPAGNYRVEVDWSLARRDELVQPLPPVEAPRISDIAKILSQEFQAARKQLESVRRCMDHSQRKDFRGALAEAGKAIAAYPRSALARVCIANVYDQQKLGPDSMIRVSEEILAIHPENRRALAFAADAYGAKGVVDRQISMLERLVSLDSTDSRSVQALVRAYVTAQRPEHGKALVDAGVGRNPGDIELRRLQWLVSLALKDWPGAVALGNELARADSSVADVQFFMRMAAALGESKLLADAADMGSRGAARFPDSDELAVLEVQLLRKAGELDRSLAAANRLVARSPRAPNAWLQKAQTQAALGQPGDSIMAALAGAVENGEDRPAVSGYAATLGRAASRTGSALKSVAELRLAVRYFKFAESAHASDTTSYLLGAASLGLGHLLYAEARAARRCDAARAMQQAYVDAQVNLPKGGRAFPGPAGEALAQLNQSLPHAEALERAVCRR